MTRTSPYRYIGPAALASATAAVRVTSTSSGATGGGGGNLGAGLAAKGTLPTIRSGYIQFATGTGINTNYSSIPSAAGGDTIVGLVSSVSLGDDSITFTQDAGNPTWLAAQEDAVAGTDSRYWFARGFHHAYDGVDTSDLIGGNLNNRLMMLSQVATAGLGASAQLLELSVLDGNGPTELVGNVVTFPLADIPAGWTFVYGVHKWDDSGSDTWVGATELERTSTTSLNDGLVTLATVDGPQTDHAVTWTDASGQTAAGGGVAYVIAVPGVA